MSAIDWVANNPYWIGGLFLLWLIFGIVLFIDCYNKRRKK